jgi:selenocysteine lyase/cysteine desulfurase
MERAFSEYVEQKARGTPGRLKHFAKEMEARQLAAQLLETDAHTVTFAPSTSDALNILAASLPFKPGDEILISDLEFPSNVLPWLALRRNGVRVVVVPSVAGEVRLCDLTEAITSKTRLVSISLVSYKTGAYFPYISDLAEAAHSVGAALCVDATQALGRCPVSLAGVDYLMASTFKWLMGPHGLAIVYVSPEFRRRFELAGVGWYSVETAFSEDRFERYNLKPGAACIAAGMPNFGSLYSLCESLRFLLSLDLESERKRVDRLSRELRQSLQAKPVNMLTPESADLVSGIVSFEHPEAARIGDILNQLGVVVWAGDGRVRASLHFYNDGSDVVRCGRAVDNALSQVAHAS